MKLLLDTHIWLWSLLEPKNLGRRVARELSAERNELWLSPISVWEIALLCDKGRLVLDGGVDAWIARALQAAPFHEALFTNDVAVATRGISLPHRDPADLFLAATAKVFGLTLVTADERLIAANQVRTLPNR